MYEDVSMAACAGEGLVEQARAGFAQAREGAVEIGHSQRNVVQAGAALFEELRDGRIGCGGLEKLDARIGRGQHCDVDLFGFNGFAMIYFEPDTFVELNGFLEIVDCDADVVDRWGSGRGTSLDCLGQTSRFGLRRPGSHGKSQA